MGIGSIMESHASTPFWCGRSIKNNWPKGTVREWKPMRISKRARVLRFGDQPYFLAQVFIEAANDLKTNRIKLPCESTYVFDVNKYPPKPLPKTRRGRGRPHENRFENAPAEAKTRCGICGHRGHNQLICELYEVWFDRKDPNDMVFRNIFSNFLNPNGNCARPPH